MAAKKGNNYAKGNKGGGRKPLYKSEYADQAFKYSLLSATDEQLALFFGCGVTTLNQWKKDHKEFSEALIAGKAKADAEIVNSLYQTAKGFVRDEEEIRIIEGKVERVKVQRYYPPVSRSQEYWLNNRQRATFKAKQAEDDAPAVIIAVGVTKEEAQKIASDIKGDI